MVKGYVGAGMVDREKERDGMKGPPPVCSFSCIVLSTLPPVGGV
jgi:hypothetical protein